MKQEYVLNQLPNVAKSVIANAKHKILLFNGEMGVGKTTLIKEVVKQLGVDDVANSPTFSLVNEYHSDKGEIIYHFDFYRIESEEEALDIGIEDYFYSDAWCFIEWGEKVQNLLPLDITNVNIDILDENRRTIQLKIDE
ncbi:tRNA (adenosine(37)-N6)-threonylcarbamoyltransferase complex ATPase subunit type 1 TsaE [Urechidicola vernalis]|uniref:tRNA threonylcarbamoyladenosine biosynthesis protein TsaE n=1 Tax=Urechidicola vernalis TaxID=3075600 RepID=A0ABU2Y0H5_9FLAO|nr:tRNA (adenosine(37)-N6)-threonylcarbamoyltransferase complex ATPase subunit type 1 TsaE [Urechidicola sp. P050]MDT0551649.1 tRNA (adenosine(37)-N6)-threonylcarbamoyltransferase complex ATPase subunit type 1 TsaE [Urechidicola sp. P050]